MATVSRHAKSRMVERVEDIVSFEQAKRAAKQALRSGKPIGAFIQYPEFYEYLSRRRFQSNTCSLRVYNSCVYIWKGKHKILVTAYPVPDKFLHCTGG